LDAFLGNSGNVVVDVPGVNGNVIAAAVTAVADVSAHSFKFVWIANMVIAVATGALCAFLGPVASEMTSHVESALEASDVRQSQMKITKAGTM